MATWDAPVLWELPLRPTTPLFVVLMEQEPPEPPHVSYLPLAGPHWLLLGLGGSGTHLSICSLGFP